MKQFLVALCGIPASGKTTLARQIIQLHPSQSEIELVSTDNWRDEAFYNEFTPAKENEVRAKALEKTRVLAGKQISVVHDDTNYYASMRHEVRAIAIEHDCAYATVFVATPLEVALKWNKEREVEIPDHVIQRIHERLDIPGKKYAWDEPLAIIDLSETNPKEGATRILSGLRELDAERKIPHATNETSNQLDVATRKMISEFLEDNPGLSSDSRVHATRKRILQQALEEEWDIKATRKFLKKELDDFSSADN